LWYRAGVFTSLLFGVALAVGQAASLPMTQTPKSESSDRATPNLSDIAKLRAQAEAGDAVAQFELGRAYESGNGVAQNDDLAVAWFRKAADQGSAAAENDLGIMYQLGRGVEKNKEEAVRWYRQGAKMGSREAMFNLGVSYYNGEGVADNPIAAYAWFLLAQEAGSPAAGDAVRRSAEELGPSSIHDAFLQVAEMYEKGEGLPQSYANAALWYRKEAHEIPEAALRLATLLINGTGVKQDYGEAMDLCSDYAKKHYPAAEYCVGYLYQQGLGVAPDAKQAVKWYGEAVAAGNTKAALTLAEMHLKGEGVEVNRADAFFYLFLAYERGALDAKVQAHALRKEMTKDETKRVEKQLRQRNLDPAKVFAIVDDPTPPTTRQVLPPVIR
jgi:uncharacterized protein